MSWVSFKDEEKAPFSNKKSNKGGDKTWFEQSTWQVKQIVRGIKKKHRGGFRQGGAWQDRLQDEKERKNQTRRDVVCYNYKKKRHYCWVPCFEFWVMTNHIELLYCMHVSVYMCRCQSTSSINRKMKLVKPSLEELHEDQDHVVAFRS